MTLSEFSYYIRRIGPIAVVGLILFIVFFVVIRLLVSVLTTSNEPTVFTPQFGMLDPIKFSHKVDYPPSPTFTLDNIEGRPVTATSSAEIFFVPPENARFGYPQTLSFMAKAVNFSPETSYLLNETQATFENGLQKLGVDITNFNFTFDVNFSGQGEIFENTIIPDKTVIVNSAIEFLRKMDRYPDDLAQGTNNIIYLKYDPVSQEFAVVTDVALANVVEVDFFPPDIDHYPIVSPKYFNSQNYVAMIFKPGGKEVIKAQIRHFAKDTSFAPPYPIKTGDQAWEELSNGKGIIVSAGQNNSNITVREMFLGYYNAEDYQTYFQPVYVFLGDNNFAAYVPAVDEQYIKK